MDQMQGIYRQRKDDMKQGTLHAKVSKKEKRKVTNGWRCCQQQTVQCHMQYELVSRKSRKNKLNGHKVYNIAKEMMNVAANNDEGSKSKRGNWVVLRQLKPIILRN